MQEQEAQAAAESAAEAGSGKRLFSCSCSCFLLLLLLLLCASPVLAQPGAWARQRAGTMAWLPQKIMSFTSILSFARIFGVPIGY